jgi:hypothetical protein
MRLINLWCAKTPFFDKGVVGCYRYSTNLFRLIARRESLSVRHPRLELKAATRQTPGELDGPKP